MTLWEIVACIEGYNRVHGGEQKPSAPTDEEFEEAKRLHGDD